MPWLSPRLVTDYYSRIVDNFVSNAVSVTNLANDLAMVNLESIQSLTDTNREYWRVGVQGAKNAQQVYSRISEVTMVEFFAFRP